MNFNYVGTICTCAVFQAKHVFFHTPLENGILFYIETDCSLSFKDGQEVPI